MAGKFQFESAIEKLEDIVEKLESGELTLEDSLKQYEEGVKLTQACQKTLRDAEKKIEILTKNPNGDLSAADFDPDEVSAPKKTRKKATKKKEAEIDFDEDLI